MASTDRLSQAESDRIYQEEIRPFYLSIVDRSTAATVVFVGGTAGSGKALFVRRVAATLAASSGAAVTVSADDMCAHHPAWQRKPEQDGQATERFDADASRWVAKLYQEAIRGRKNVVFESAFMDPESLATKVDGFSKAGYAVEAIIVAVDAEKTRRAIVGRFLKSQEKPLSLRTALTPRHNESYESLRSTLRFAEQKHLFNALSIVAHDGRELYANRFLAGRWQRPAAGTAALDSERNRRLTPTELANNAIAWHQLVALTQLIPHAPREVLDQAVAWRQEASSRAMADPEAAQRYHWALAAEAFRTLSRDHFLREFPVYAGAIERLDKASKHASQQYNNPQDRDAFVAQTRLRLAESIEEGRQFGRVKVAPDDHTR